MRTIIIIPTYNEKENIKSLVEKIFSLLPDISILVVDDNSPDETRSIVRNLQSRFSRLNFHQRLNDRGFGRSYIDGFKKVINNEQYEIIIMMDADFSHDPEEILKMIEKLSGSDIVIGSRYVAGGKIKNWDLKRRILSRFANFYARTILGVSIKDLTTGFMCFRKDVLNKVNLNSINSQGYAFLIEMKYRMQKAGFKIFEHPITFTERRRGKSKMSWENIWEAVWLPWRLKVVSKKLRNRHD